MIPFTTRSDRNVMCSGLRLADIARSLAWCEIFAQIVIEMYGLRTNDSGCLP